MTAAHLNGEGPLQCMKEAAAATIVACGDFFHDISNATSGRIDDCCQDTNSYEAELNCPWRDSFGKNEVQQCSSILHTIHLHPNVAREEREIKPNELPKKSMALFKKSLSSFTNKIASLRRTPTKKKQSWETTSDNSGKTGLTIMVNSDSIELAIFDLAFNEFGALEFAVGEVNGMKSSPQDSSETISKIPDTPSTTPKPKQHSATDIPVLDKTNCGSSDEESEESDSRRLIKKCLDMEEANEAKIKEISFDSTLNTSASNVTLPSTIYILPTKEFLKNQEAGKMQQSDTECTEDENYTESERSSMESSKIT